MALSEMAKNGIIKDAKTYGGKSWEMSELAEFVGFRGNLDEAGRSELATTLLKGIKESDFWDRIGQLPNGLKRVVAVSSILATYKEFTGRDLQI